MSVDAVTVWKNIIVEAFKPKMGILGPEPQIEWIAVPRDYYNYKKGRYNNPHRVLAPIIFTKDNVTAGLADMVSRACPPPGWEMALGLEWACGQADTVVEMKNAYIFDGAPGLDLNELNPKLFNKIHEYFHVLKTDNSYHFYGKNPLPGSVEEPLKRAEIEKLVDLGWLQFSNERRGYVRVTHNVKGPITKVEP